MNRKDNKEKVESQENFKIKEVISKVLFLIPIIGIILAGIMAAKFGCNPFIEITSPYCDGFLYGSYHGIPFVFVMDYFLFG